MSIDLTTQATITTATDTPVLSDWQFSPSADIRIIHRQGADMPASIVMHTRFKDVIGLPSTGMYGRFYYKVYIVGFANETPLMTITGTLVTGPDDRGDYVNNLEGDITYTFQNLNTLLPGERSWAVYHEIWGRRNVGGAWTMIERYSKIVGLKVLSNQIPTFTPNPVEFTWTQDQAESNVRSGPLNVSGASWTFSVPAPFFFEAVAGTFVNPTPSGGSAITGTGAKVLYLIMNGTALPDPFTQNPMQFILDMNAGLAQVPINVTILQPSGLFLQKEEMYFEAYRGMQSAEPQTNRIHFPGQYYFVSPPWLTIVPNQTSDTSVPTFSVLSPISMEAGIYEYNVEIRSVTDNAIVGLIHVVYRVIGNVSSPYRLGENAFTLDRKFISLSSEIDDTYYHVLVTATVSEMYTLALQDFAYKFRYPLHKRKQKFNIGLLIDRLMSRMNDFRDESNMPYVPAAVRVQLIEKSTTDPAHADAFELPVINFVAGLDPGLAAGCCILDINQAPSRITPSTFLTVNYLIRGYQEIAWYKNGEVVNSYLRGDGIYTDAIDVSVYEIKEGDVFAFGISTSDGNIIKQYKAFPEGRYSNYIVWENEYKLKSEMLFTGDFTVKSDLENRTQTLNIDLVDVLAKIESNKVSSLTIDTGWILKSDIPSIESLARAKRAALRLPTGQYINLVPVGKTMISVDNKQALISYNLEFQINRAYNEEIYSF